MSIPFPGTLRMMILRTHAGWKLQGYVCAESFARLALREGIDAVGLPALFPFGGCPPYYRVYQLCGQSFCLG